MRSTLRMNASDSSVSPGPMLKKQASFIHYLRKHKALYLLSLPGICFFILFKYIPLFGSVMAFQHYDIFSGLTGSEWVGLDNFRRMFAFPDFQQILTNTILIGFYSSVRIFLTGGMSMPADLRRKRVDPGQGQ